MCCFGVIEGWYRWKKTTRLPTAEEEPFLICLRKDGLELAGLTVVALVTHAKTGGVIANTTTRAITTLGTTITTEGVKVRRALNERAIRTTVTDITLATKLL